MRYLREYVDEHGKSAYAHEDQVTSVEVGEHVVSIISKRDGVRVVSQFSHDEMARIMARCLEAKNWDQQIAEVDRRYFMKDMTGGFMRAIDGFLRR